MHFEKHYIVKLLFWLALISSYLLAVLPQENVPQLTPFNDKGNHFLAFAVLTLLILHAYRVRYFTAFILMMLYGVLIEVSQLFAVNRHGELLDVLADTIGVVIGILLYWLIEKFYHSKCLGI
ncbi:MAG: VanZ family protein [Campylobacterota bacterium]|nr:VanZ family protein [Campylobacterota bacterium]